MGTSKYRDSRAHAVQAGATATVDARPEIRAVTIAQTIASAGTIATLYVPPSGQRFRVRGGWLTPSAADTVILRGVASAAFQLNARCVQNGMWDIAVPDNGIACGSANSALVLDTGAGGTIVTGTIFVSDEA